MMVCAELGIEDCDFTNGAAYIATWLETLRNDKREVFRATSDAQRITDYLLSFHPDWKTHEADKTPAAESGDAALAAAT